VGQPCHPEHRDKFLAGQPAIKHWFPPVANVRCAITSPIRSVKDVAGRRPGLPIKPRQGNQLGEFGEDPRRTRPASSRRPFSPCWNRAGAKFGNN